MIFHSITCARMKVPKEVLKTEGEARGFQHFPRALANVNDKIMYVRYYCITSIMLLEEQSD